MANGISKCFIAGTLVCTVNGLMAIENIVAGDMVLSANPLPAGFSSQSVFCSPKTAAAQNGRTEFK